MNKTLTINMCGMVFHIEEQAYDKLKKYLESIRSCFAGTEGGTDIIADIENRIAELFAEKVGPNKQALLTADVEAVIEIMGKPESFASEAESTTGAQSNQRYQQQSYYRNPAQRRRVFRDGDDKIIGGVCSGVAAYFDFDPIWLRLGFAISFFGFGMGLMVYILLWIIIPEAKTTAEKLEMRGEPINISNIEKSVKEEMDDLKKRVNNFSEDFKKGNYRSQVSQTTHNFASFVSNLAKGAGVVFLKITGGVLIFIGILFLIAFSGLLFGSDAILNINADGISRFSLYTILDLIFVSEQQLDLTKAGLLLLVFIPLIMLVFAGVKMLFKIKGRQSLLKGIALTLWTIGLVICIITVIQVSKDFSKVSKQTSSVNLGNPGNKTILLKVNNYDLNKNNNEEELLVSDENRRIMAIENNQLLLGYPELVIVKADNDSTMEMDIVRKGRGSNRKEASSRSQNIQFEFNQNDSIITFNDCFKIPVSDKFRAQELRLILKIPVGKTIYLDNSFDNFNLVAKNVNDAYVSDMMNRRWIMTTNGLSCVDCQDLVVGKKHKKHKIHLNEKEWDNDWDPINDEDF